MLLRDTLTAKNATLAKSIYEKSGINGVLNWLVELALNRSVPDPYELATRYASIGKKEEALYWLEKYFDTQPVDLPRINNRPQLETLRSEPRFQAMIKKLGLSDYQTPK